MSSEGLPAPKLSAVERVRRENRRDMPLGISTSLVVHACFALFFASFIAAALYVETKMPQVQEQPSQVITIETLVRPPQTVAVQKPQPIVVQRMQRVVSQTAPVRTSAASAHSQSPALPTSRAVSRSTPGQTSRLSTYALLSGSPGKHRAAKKRHTATQSSAQPVMTSNQPATAQAPAATNGTNVYNAPPDNRSDDEAAGGYMSSGHGPTWSEGPPGRGAGGGVDTCAPSRGGFLSHRHR